MRSDVAVVILAGGEGRRIGGAKPLTDFAGERLVDRAARKAAKWSALVAIAVRNPAQIAPVESPIIIDAPDIAGPLGGLISALRFGAEHDRTFVLTIPTDMPFLPDDLLSRLVSGIAEGGCAVVSSGGHLHPVCGLWRTSALEQLEPYLAGEQRSLRSFAALVGCDAVEWSGLPSDPFFNINTADDLAEAKRIIAG